AHLREDPQRGCMDLFDRLGRQDFQRRERVGQPAERQLRDAACRAPWTPPRDLGRHRSRRATGPLPPSRVGDNGRIDRWPHAMFARATAIAISRATTAVRMAPIATTAPEATTKRTSTRAAMAPATTALSVTTRNGVDEIRWTRTGIPGGTAIVIPIPAGSSWTPMTKYGARSGAISR